MSDKKTLIFDIEKFAVHDAPVIRTVVFMKGCPLHCLWCHNPESQAFQSELLFNTTKCVKCGMCVPVCPEKCHSVTAEEHTFDRSKCVACGRCADVCPAEALKLVGKEMTVDEVLQEVLKDRVFYQNSGGGMTLSGGEPLAHFEFTLALLKAAKEAGLHTAIETSGFASWERIRQLLPVVDLWLWDVKATPEKYETLTGVPWDPIYKNLKNVAESGGKIVLRCPLVPGVNDEDAHLIRIASLANELGASVQQIDLEPYHPMGEGKNQELGRSDIFRSEFASADSKKHWQEVISGHTATPVHLY